MSRMLAVVALATTIGTTGCFSSWAITQASGAQHILDEKARDERVPMPDVRERLVVAFPLAPRYSSPPPAGASASPAPSASNGGTSAGTSPGMTPAPVGEQLPFALQCTSTQSASDTVYHSAFRYGGTFRKVAGVMFLVEAIAVAGFYFAGDREKPGTQLGIGFFGLDALGTAALFMVPRKEIYKKQVVPVTSTIRTDCPAGLILEIASESFPVDAAGRIGELGEVALDTWMKSPSAPIRLTFEAGVIDLRLGQTEICTWNRLHHQDQSACPPAWTGSPMIAATLEVPMGTLTRVDSP